MECLKAQAVISAALDDEATDVRELDLAKAHCRDCAECSRLVRALVAVKRAPLPSPPDDLHDRIMTAVRAEHARASTIAARPVPSAAAPGAARAAEAAANDDPAGSIVDVSRRAWSPRNRRAVLAWSAAAATVFIVAGIGAVAGVRSMFPGTASRDAVVLESTAGDATNAAPEGLDAASPQPDASALSAATPFGLIVVDGAVYRSAGVDGSVSESDLREIATTRSDLGEQFVSNRQVLGTDDRSRVFIEAPDGRMLAFDRVTRSYQGVTYVLRSGPVESFSAGARLPDGIPEPASEDGSPVFRPATEDAGDGVYVIAGRTPAEGIALAPGAEAALASGWTWWTPQR